MTAAGPNPLSEASRAEEMLAAVMLDQYPDAVSRLIEKANPEEAAKLLGDQPADVAIRVLRAVTADRAARILPELPETARGRVLAGLNPNWAAALIARLSDEQRDACLAPLDEGLANDLRALASYEPDTAGGLMDPRVATFRSDAKVDDVIHRLETLRSRRITDVFSVDAEGRLVSAIPLLEIILAAPGASLSTLGTPSPACVQATSSSEEVVQTFASHRISSLPVVDFDGRLLGVIRQRELIRASTQEATAASVTMVGASEQERALSSPWFAVRKRLPWLQVNLLTAFLAAAVVGVFESTIAQVTALAVLLPVVAGQSGNTGAQALAVTMRGLALREVRTRDWLRVAIKETVAGLGNGAAVAATTSLAVYFWSGSLTLALVIAVSMVISMGIAGLSGAAIPMLLTAIDQDPAQSSSIILTTVTDVVGFFSFLGIATLLMSALLATNP